MKKLTKLIFSCAAVAAVTAALGTAALAEEVKVVGNNLSGTYDTETGILNLTDGYVSDAEGDQTILVLKPDATIADVKDADIAYVNQAGDVATIARFADLADGTYTVRVGGGATIFEGTFTIGDDEPNPPTPGDIIIIGDVNLDGDIDSTDATWVLESLVNNRTLDAKNAKAAYTRTGGNGRVAAQDSANILKYSAALGEEAVANVGAEVTYTAE